MVHTRVALRPEVRGVLLRLARARGLRLSEYLAQMATNTSQALVVLGVVDG